MINSRQQLEAYQFPLNTEFRFKNFKEGVKTYGLSYYSVSRCILVDDNMNIINSEISVFSNKIDKHLKKL